MKRPSSSPLLTKKRTRNLRGAGTFTNLQKFAVNTGVTMWGASLFNTDTSGEHPAGMYEITGDGKMTYLGAENIYPSSGGWVVDGVYYALESVSFFGFYSVELIAYDTDTWTSRDDLSIAYDDTELFATTVAYNYKNGELYGCFYDIETDNYYFAKADVLNDSKSVICTLTEGWTVSFFDDKNNLYIIDYEGDLYKVDTSDGDMSLIDTVGFMPYYNTGAAYDAITGKAYWAINDQDDYGYMVEIDLATGKGEKMFDFEYDDQVGGLYIEPVFAEPGAPSAITNFTVTFPEGALSGKATFTMPATTFDGTAATGELTYTLYMNGEVYATATSSYGAAVEVPVAVDSDGTYTFSVVATNSVGSGPELKQKLYVGHDTPKAPQNVKAAWENGVFTITWDAAAATMNDGYIDPAATTYTVTRYPGETVVAENINATTLSDNVAEPSDFTVYYYTVTATYDGRTSQEGESNHVSLGKILPPYSNTFDSAESVEGYTIIDANNDGTTWETYNGRLYVGYNSNADMDDWLITPAISLEAGNIYQVSFDISGATTSYPEKFEFLVGNANTVEGMTTTLIEATEIVSSDPVNNSLYFTPETSGIYYFGVHGISAADMYNLYLYNFSISAPMSADAPCEVGNINITPDAQGGLTAIVAFTAPTKDFFGNNDLTEITKIEVNRNGELIKTFDNPTPGSALSFDDTVDNSAAYTYEFVPFNASGRGKSASKSAFIGINIPGTVTNFVAKETTTNGEVNFTWEAPTVDKDGNPINPNLITYSLREYVNGSAVSIEDNITELSYTYQAVEPGSEQSFKQFAVFAATTTGEGEGMMSALIPVGEPYTLPYSDTFAGAGLEHILAVMDVEGECSWQLYDDNGLGVADANGDNGYIAMSSQYVNSCGLVYTGKINVTATKPIFSFQTYNIVGDNGTLDENEVTLCVSEDGGNTFTDLKTYVIGEECNAENDWCKLKYDLSAYAGKTILVGLKCRVVTYTYVLLDDIKLAENVNNDIVASNLTAPEYVKSGEEFNIEFRLTNDGALDAKGVKVELYRNGTKIAEKERYDLDSDEYCFVKFTDTLNVTGEKENEYYAVAVYAADENLDNNTTNTVTVTLKSTPYPTVQNLSGEDKGSGVDLKWDAPTLETGHAIKEVTDDFEDYASWGNNVGNWTLVDGDGVAVGGIQGLTLPGISGPQSYWIMDDTDASIAESAAFKAYSGNKYLAQMYAYSGNSATQCDDWAISPRLYGGAQTVSFYAKSFSGNYTETFEVLYSTTDKEISSFTSVKTVENVSDTWTEYSFDLPEGAVYFAIRCVSYDKFMLFIDDATYTIEEGDYELLGYNIYREGVKLNDAPVTDTTFHYVDPEIGNITYSVSAVYATGESAAVNVVVATSKVEATATDALGIAVDGREIVITNADGAEVAIATADGKMVARRNVESDMRIAVEKGVYIVKAGKRTAKLIVK